MPRTCNFIELDCQTGLDTAPLESLLMDITALFSIGESPLQFPLGLGAAWLKGKGEPALAAIDVSPLVVSWQTDCAAGLLRSWSLFSTSSTHYRLCWLSTCL